MSATATSPDGTESMMTYSFTVTLKGGMKKPVTAFRRWAGAPWTIKPRVEGKQKWMSLEVVGSSKADLDLVKKRATLRIQALIDGKFEGGARVKASAPVVVYATIGKLMKAYEDGIRIETEIKRDTALENVARLRQFVREIASCRPEEIEKQSTEILTAAAVERWQDVRMREALELDDVEKGRAKRNMDSLLNKARSLFTPAAMNCYRKAGLVLPDLQGFRTVPMKGGWNKVGYVPIDEVTIERMNRAAWEELKPTKPAAFLTFLLMLRCGLRNSEVEHARRSWIERSQAVVMLDGKPQLQEVAFLAVIARPGWDGPKNGKDHRIPLAPDVLQALEELAGEEYLLGGTAQQRWEVTHRDVCDFVRQFLPDLDADPERGRIKAAYELRKHFGAVVASTQGLDRAAEYLGDRRDTVEKHYHAWLQHRTARPMLASELTPNVIAAVA